ncbi:MAG: hypothetical protein RR732_04610 [Bacilli bacterium]
MKVITDFNGDKIDASLIAFNENGKDKQLDNVLNNRMPVGSIYLSVLDTNPEIWFGGKWERIAQGRTLVGVDINDTYFNTVKKTGGSKYMQNHSHTAVTPHYYPAINNGTTYGHIAGGSWVFGELSNAVAVNPSGDGDSQNLPPYFTCYIWCRIS